MGNLPGRTFEYDRDTDTSNIGLSPIFAQCKMHRPWALFREGTVIVAGAPRTKSWIPVPVQ